MKDDEIQRMIDIGMYPKAEEWLRQKPSRRIGVLISQHPDFSLQMLVISTKNLGVEEVWCADIRQDEDGMEYAAARILALPKSKRVRNRLFRGLNLSQTISRREHLVDVGQKFIYNEMPTRAELDASGI